MACPEYRDRIMEMQEGTLPAGDRPAVEGHLTVCSACRRLGQRLGELDAAMAASHSVPGLCPDFKVRLMKRIEQETPRLSREAIEARRQEMEAECKAVMAHLSHRVWLARLPLLLDVLGLISLTFAVWGILRSMPESRSILEGLGPLTARVGTDSMAWIWTVICLLIGLVCVFKPRPVIRL